MAKLSEKGLFADVDNGADTLPKKIRNGEIAQYNFILGASPYHSFLLRHSHFAIFPNFQRAFIFASSSMNRVGLGRSDVTSRLLSYSGGSRRVR